MCGTPHRKKKNRKKYTPEKCVSQAKKLSSRVAEAQNENDNNNAVAGVFNY